MKLKIVIKLPLHKEKDKSKAMQIAVGEEGVSSVCIGKENDAIEVIGEGVDSVCLAKCLRKKFSFAHILSVEEVKPKPPPPPPEPEPIEISFRPPPPICVCPPPFEMPCHYPHFYDTGPPNNCPIM